MTKQEYNDPVKRAKVLLKEHRKADRELKGLDKPKSALIQGIGKLLREKRIAKNLTQLDLEKLSGISFAYILRIEQGKMNPSVEVLEALFSALELDLRVSVVRKKA